MSKVPLKSMIRYGSFYVLGVRALNNSGTRKMRVCGQPFIKVTKNWVGQLKFSKIKARSQINRCGRKFSRIKARAQLSRCAVLQ